MLLSYVAFSWQVPADLTDRELWAFEMLGGNLSVDLWTDVGLL